MPILELPKVPQKKNALFTNGPDFHLNACVGDNGGPYDMADYGYGFFEGGKAVIDACKSGHFAVDVLVYPAAFNFRHGIELYLKQLTAMLSFLNGGGGFKKDHQIVGLWERFLEQRSALKERPFDAAEIDEAGRMIEAFWEIDPTGQVFRYPEDIKGNPHLADLRIINVEVLGDYMVRMHEILQGWYNTLLDAMQDRAEWEAALGEP